MDDASSAEFAALRARLAPLVRSRQLAPADIPDVLRLAVLYANSDPALRTRFTAVDEMVQLAVTGQPPAQWLWLRFDHGAFASGRGPVAQTLTVEFKDEATFVGVFTGATPPQLALFSGQLRVTPLERALVFAQFFALIMQHWARL